MASYGEVVKIVFLCFACVHLSLSEDNATEVYNNGQVMDGGDPVGVFSGWNFASIANKVLIVVIVIIGIIAAVIAYKYFRIQQKRAKLNRYKRLERNEETLSRDQECDDEIVVYEKD